REFCRTNGTIVIVVIIVVVHAEIVVLVDHALSPSGCSSTLLRESRRRRGCPDTGLGSCARVCGVDTSRQEAGGAEPTAKAAVRQGSKPKNPFRARTGRCGPIIFHYFNKLDGRP